MSDSTLATFRINQALWDEFKTHATQEGDSATQRLIKLIMADLGKVESEIIDIDSRIESYLESHLDKLIDKTAIAIYSDIDKKIDVLKKEIKSDIEGK